MVTLEDLQEFQNGMIGISEINNMKYFSKNPNNYINSVSKKNRYEFLTYAFTAGDAKR